MPEDLRTQRKNEGGLEGEQKVFIQPTAELKRDTTDRGKEMKG